jgi:hypothetical protein
MTDYSLFQRKINTQSDTFRNKDGTFFTYPPIQFVRGSKSPLITTAVMFEACSGYGFEYVVLREVVNSICISVKRALIHR